VFGNGGSLNRGISFDFLGTYQDKTVYADFVKQSLQAWDNDPASAPNVGLLRKGTRSSAATTTSFSPSLSYQRSGSAWGYGPDGRLKQFTTNQPRFEFDPVTLKPVGLRIEESRTNSITNNSAVGTVIGTIGSGGVLATNWSNDTTLASGSGMSIQVVAAPVIAGIPYIDIRMFGTPTLALVAKIVLEGATAIVAAQNQVWTLSSYLALAAGAFTNVTYIKQTIFERDAGGVFKAQGDSANVTASLTSTTARLAHTYTLGNAGTFRTQPGLVVSFPSGLPIDFTLRIGAPQMELGSFATSPILTTNAGTVTRNADQLTGSTAGWFNPAAGTLVVEATAGQNAPTSTWPTLAQVDSGYSTDRTTLYNSQSSANLGFDQMSSNANIGMTNVGSFTVGQPFRTAGAWSSGTNALVNGGAISVQASAPKPVGVTTLRIGQGVNLAYWNGFIRRLTYYPRALSSAEMIAATEWSADLVANGLLDPSVTFTRSSIGTYFDKNGVMQTAQADCPRLDYDPVTGAFKGLLIEELRTNLITQSNAIITPTNWSGVSGSAVATTAVVGVGGLPAFKVVEDATAATQHYVYPIIPTLTDSTDYVFSVFARAAERTWLQITTTDKANSTLRCWYDLTNGALGTNSGIGTCFPSIQNYGNGWYRCSVRRNVATGASTPRYRVSTATADNITVYDGNGTSGIYACAAQLEAGTFATSYIPTTTVIQPRLGDTVSITTPATQNWWNSAGMTLQAAVIPEVVNIASSSSNLAVLAIDSSNRVNLRVPPAGSTSVDISSVIAGTSTSSTPNSASMTANVETHVAIALAPTDQAISVNSNTPVSSTLTLPAMASMASMTLGSSFGGNYQNGWIKRLTVKGRRVSNTELQALSA
jgi:hypothetical protein